MGNWYSAHDQMSANYTLASYDNLKKVYGESSCGHRRLSCEISSRRENKEKLQSKYFDF